MIFLRSALVEKERGRQSGNDGLSLRRWEVGMRKGFTCGGLGTFEMVLCVLLDEIFDFRLGFLSLRFARLF